MLVVGFVKFVVASRAVFWTVDVGRKGAGAIGRSNGASDKGRAALFLGDGIGHAAGELGGLDVDIAHAVLEAVVSLCDGGTRKGVGLDDVRACFKELAVDGLDNVRAGDAEQVVVALQVAFVAVERRIAEILLLQLILLDHGTHRAVKKDDALCKEVGEELTFGGQWFIGSILAHEI